jgi:hypothetical protein
MNLTWKNDVDRFLLGDGYENEADFKFDDRVVRIGEGQKQGVVGSVFHSGGIWWLAFEGESDWRYARRFRRVA